MVVIINYNMADDITSEQSVIMDKFVEGLEERTKEVAKEILAVPNTPDCQPEVLALYVKFGNQLNVVFDQIEVLRQELGVHYNLLQPELRERLYR
jgi:hypothetical protein